MCAVRSRLKAAWSRRPLRRGERGATAVELGLLIAGIGIVVIPGLAFLNSTLSSTYQSTAETDNVCTTDGCDLRTTLGGLAQALVLLAAVASPASASPTTRVVGGSEADISAMPFCHTSISC